LSAEFRDVACRFDESHVLRHDCHRLCLQMKI
jgi:hypothetical protein